MLVAATTGITRTNAARSRSLTIITSRWFQRSTYAPATGESRRFGSVAATKTNATESGESGTVATRNVSATWWTRSPKRLISWPVQSAENEPLSARRTYGLYRTRFRTLTRRSGGAPTVASIGTVPAAGAGASATARPPNAAAADAAT